MRFPSMDKNKKINQDIELGFIVNPTKEIATIDPIYEDEETTTSYSRSRSGSNENTPILRDGMPENNSWKIKFDNMINRIRADKDLQIKLLIGLIFIMFVTYIYILWLIL